MTRLLALVIALFLAFLSGPRAQALEVGVFRAEVTPPIGSPLCGGSVLPAQVIGTPLWARGVVLRASDQPPVVLCAVDWVGIANGSHDAWRAALAQAADTTPDRVAVQTLHQHDAPFADTSTEALLAAAGLPRHTFNPDFAQEAMDGVAAAVADAAAATAPLTHLSYGKAKVEKFASNRRLIGEDGKIAGTRWTACKDPELRAAPEGVVDPWVRVVGLWDDNELLTTLSWYATHPQSFYNSGNVNYDTVGMARAIFEAETGVATAIHFNGAGGNISAGKYNDGAPENRPVLAQRLADGMSAAWADAVKQAVGDGDLEWTVARVALPVRADVELTTELARVADPELPAGERARAARDAAWLQRMAGGHQTPLSKLTLGPVDILNLPGELFIEYQLAAQAMAPDRFQCTAAYGDYGPGYICTEVAYAQGGYEPQKYTSRTAPSVEGVLLSALQRLVE